MGGGAVRAADSGANMRPNTAWVVSTERGTERDITSRQTRPPVGVTSADCHIFLNAGSGHVGGVPARTQGLLDQSLLQGNEQQTEVTYACQMSMNFQCDIVLGPLLSHSHWQ